jgi:hypothetical protein
MPACGQDWLSYKTQASQFHDNLRVPLPVVETALLLDARGWPVHRGLARRPRGREVRQSSRSITLPFDRKRRGIFAARLLVSCPLPCEHREDDVIDPLALEPEAPDHMSLLAETKPLHESDRAGVARVDGSGDAMLSKFAEQVADNGSQRFCGVPAALESRRHVIPISASRESSRTWMPQSPINSPPERSAMPSWYQAPGVSGSMPASSSK